MAAVIQSVEYISNLTTRVSLGLPDVPDATGQTVTRQGLNTTRTLKPTTTPPATADAYVELQLVGGALTVDLTALPGGEAGAVDLTGLKVRAVKLKAVDLTGAATPHVVTMKQGATNGYTGGGSGWQAPAPPGGEAAFYWADGASAVGGSNKTLDFAGTGTDTFLLAVIGG